MTSLENLVGQVYGNIRAIAPEPDNNNNHGGNEKKDTTTNNNRDKRPKGIDALEIVRSKCLSLFVDQIGEPYAAIKMKDHIETIEIASNRFKEWVIKVCYDYRREEKQNQLQKLQQEELLKTFLHSL